MVGWRRPVSLPLLPFGAPDQGYATARVTSPFGWRPNPLYPQASRLARAWHNGLDIGNGRAGDEVVAADDGTVLAEGLLGLPWSDPAPPGAGWVGGYGGLMAAIAHGGGLVSVYAHLDRTVVDRDQRVAAGDVIGYIGATGSAKIGGAHLHFEIEINGVEVDPYPLITAEPADDRLDRLLHERALLREAKPIAAGQWDAWTHLTPATVGQLLAKPNRMATELLFLRASDPTAAAQWAEWSRLTSAADGKPLDAEDRAAGEVMFLRRAAA